MTAVDTPLPWHTAIVIGLGASGLSAARVLLQLGLEVRAYDRKRDAALPEGAVDLRGLDEIPAAGMQGVDVVVLSPGVPPGPAREAARHYAPDAAITGELGLGLQLWFGRHIAGLAPVPLVLITGTNGKSTVTALTGELLRAGGFTPFVGGNLGTPLCDAIAARLQGHGEAHDALVLECSSFQLETLPAVPNDVGMVLNVTPDHLDRYPTMEAYADTKAEVFRNLVPGGLALLDHGGEFRERLQPSRTDVRVLAIGEPGHAYIEGDGSGRTLVLGDERFDRALLRLPGRHNASNALFALAAARHFGVPHDACARTLTTFAGLPHRMVLVRELDGVRYYNDSKATNVASAIASLGGLDERFVLIAGGRGKGDDLAPLAELLQRRGRGVVAIGEAGPLFHALGGDTVPAAFAPDLTAAVTIARGMARTGDAVVLAPACASYDQFRSYAHRGDVFTAAVHALL